MTKQLGKVVVLLGVLLLQAACAEDAISPVNPLGSDATRGASEKTGEDTVELMAFHFSGSDDFSTDCNVAIALMEEDHVEGDEHGHHHKFVIKFDYILHNVIPTDTLAELYLFDNANQTYYSPEDEEPGTVPALASLLLKDDTIVPDLNKLKEYRDADLISQFVRMKFYDVDAHELMEAMEDVLEDPSQFDSKKAGLNQMQKSVLQIYHNGHYDAVSCDEFQLDRVQMTEFNFDEDHDDDHDHDHGHNHDH